MTRQQLESDPDWQATFSIVKRAGRHSCLMRTVPDAAGRLGYYWYDVDYNGIFAWGATRTFLGLAALRDAIADGFLQLVAGEIPADDLSPVGRRDR